MWNITGVDPGAGKGRGTNRLSCKGLGKARDPLVGCCVFAAVNHHGITSVFNKVLIITKWICSRSPCKYLFSRSFVGKCHL